MDPAACPHCGAPPTDDGPCQARFDRLLSLEFTDPGYGAVHHLTVPAFMLQHDRYSHAGWLAARELLRRFVEDGVRPQEMRREHPRHEGSTVRGPSFADFGRITWSRTIADVGAADAAAYRSDVEAWAASVLGYTRDVARRYADALPGIQSK
jgi:hypothetical protein